jgi:hypothetical protein
MWRRARRQVLTLKDMEFMERGELRGGWYVKYYADFMDLGVYVFISKFHDTDDFEYRFVLANGFPNVGPVYLTNIAIFVNNQRIIHERGRHVIPTRLAWARRWSPNQHIMDYRHLKQFEVASRPQWLRDKLRTQEPGGDWRTTFGIYDSWGHGLGYAHGGGRLAPFHASWWKCVEGYHKASKWLDGTTDRCRLMILDRNTGEIDQIHREYSLVHATVGELAEFAHYGDGWCPYEDTWTKPQWEGGVGTHDGAHLRRAFSEALALREFDPWARMWLDVVHSDAEMGYNLNRNVEPTSVNGTPWGTCLWYRLENEPQNNAVKWGGRELAHVMMLSAYLGRDTDKWRYTIETIATSNGITNYVGPEDYHLQEARTDPPGMIGRINQSFESMFMIEACRLNGLDATAQRARDFIGPQPRWYFDVDTGEQANAGGTNSYVGWYSAFSHFDLSEHEKNNKSAEENIWITAQDTHASIAEHVFDTIPSDMAEEIFNEFS